MIHSFRFVPTVAYHSLRTSFRIIYSQPTFIHFFDDLHHLKPASWSHPWWSIIPHPNLCGGHSTQMLCSLQVWWSRQSWWSFLQPACGGPDERRTFVEVIDNPWGLLLLEWRRAYPPEDKATTAATPDRILKETPPRFFWLSSSMVIFLLIGHGHDCWCDIEFDSKKGRKKVLIWFRICDMWEERNPKCTNVTYYL